MLYIADGRHAKLNPKPNWAVEAEKKALERKDDEDDVMSFLRSSKKLISSEEAILLPSDHLNIERVKDANYKGVSEGPITALKFHPNGKVIVTASASDRKLSLFNVNMSTLGLI